LWTPLRFPGQYFDEETSLFENWHRYYDPMIGRYLQPEPLLRHSSWVRGQARLGINPPVYGYANNNPLHFIDSNGLAAGALPFIWPTATRLIPIIAPIVLCALFPENEACTSPAPIPTPTNMCMSNSDRCRLVEFIPGGECKYKCGSELRIKYFNPGGGGDGILCPDEIDIKETDGKWPWD
jgi:RHS repeat-associated protein